jgi:hypothetical protein
MGIIPTINGIELGFDVLIRQPVGKHAIAGYSTIARTDTYDHEYPVIPGSERKNINGVYRVELRVAHDPPRIPLPTLPVPALTQSEAWRKVVVSDTGRAN